MALKKFEFADKVFGFIASEKVDKEIVASIHKTIDEALTKHDHISLYFEDTTEAYITPRALFNDFLYRINSANSYTRIAMVSDKKSVELYTKFKALFIKSEMKHFPLKARMEALNWVSAI
tara:strand:- start:449 stop:808 length:360 start_codon:yes stop_codon:yes gene_type:complete